MAGWLLLNSAYLVYTTSALFKEILYLRATLLVATFLYMVYGLVDPNWSVFFWNIPVAIIHLYAVWQLLKERRGVDLDDEAKAIHTLMFTDLDPVPFNLFWHEGEQRTIVDEVMIIKGEPVTELSLIMDGEVDVDVSPGVSVRLSQYRILGEITSFTGGTATATVTALGQVRVRVWKKDQLKAIGLKYPSFELALVQAMGHEAARKIF